MHVLKDFPERPESPDKIAIDDIASYRKIAAFEKAALWPGERMELAKLERIAANLRNRAVRKAFRISGSFLGVFFNQARRPR